MTYPACPQCHSNFTYHDGSQLVCPECAHEWHEGDTAADADDSQVIKQGTKVKSIRLQEGDHNLGCKIDGTPMNLKSEFVKKA